MFYGHIIPNYFLKRLKIMKETINIDWVDFPANTSIGNVIKTLDYIKEAEEKEENSEREAIIESILITIENRQAEFMNELILDIREMMKEI